MKSNTIRPLFLLLCLALSGLAGGCSSGDDGDGGGKEEEADALTVKVMTYNIYGARSGGIPDLDALAEVIRRADPDLVALQEVDRFTARNGTDVDIARELAERCGMEYHFARAMDMNPGAYGDAILSKLPVKSAESYTMSVDPELGGEQRSVALVEVETAAGPLHFISTHLDHLSDPRNRVRQAEELLDIVADIPAPLIVGGDFNATPDSEPIAILNSRLRVGCRNGNCTQPTFPTSGPDRIIDYIFYKGIDRLSVRQYGIYEWASKESDHFPVVATFQLD
ncbi:endonuclease/exonuclease/phosphatase family protein [Sinomicrobium soli]|uniref:endonuclease/exonuclease/phosphatase family protein n=1 Tax=Sinomicrobium sp. N-1-3-6 TaxID=2219864 RepID=UPI0013750DBB|nr:endonuclease/exonuclease/phosphatase family protein [Sinomicrobium sp. N-1-3-6]